MNIPLHHRNTAPLTYTRRRFLQAGTTAVAGVAFLGATRLGGPASPAPTTTLAAGSCGESVQDILNLALTVERAATTFYYTGLTSAAVMRSPQLAGGSGNPNAVAADGNPENVANLQAALDQEQKHAAILANAGAVSPYRHFYFPTSAFSSLGYTSKAGTFLWTLDHLETACIAVYLAAVKRFGELQRPDLAVLCVRNLTIESEHRALYRVISHDDPADNITLNVVDFSCVSSAAPYFESFLSGHGFPRGVDVTHAIGLPTATQTARVIGQYTSS